jgi:hypothetical protein
VADALVRLFAPPASENAVSTPRDQIAIDFAIDFLFFIEFSS